MFVFGGWGGGGGVRFSSSTLYSVGKLELEKTKTYKPTFVKFFWEYVHGHLLSYFRKVS